METSNSPDITADVTIEAASPVESSAPPQINAQDAIPSAPAPKELSLKDKILAQKDKPVKDETPELVGDAPKSGVAPVVPADAAQAAVAPAYQANFKFKAFGKEKEIPELFRSVIKDEASERQVREVFTRAEAFDDMKGRYENASREGQQILNDFTTLDRDVRKVTGFLNKRDLDNFFASVRLTDKDLISYLQTKAQYMNDPMLAQQYQQQVQLRADHFNQQEKFQSLQSNYSNQAVQARTMQLDNMLGRPEITGVASAWDSKMGEIGSFRNLVIQEAANYAALHQQDISAEQAVNLVYQKYGKLVAPAPQAQVAPVGPQGTQAPVSAAPQAPNAPVVVAPKPSIPTLNGKGTSPVKQVPKSLADLTRMGKELAKQEASDSY